MSLTVRQLKVGDEATLIQLAAVHKSVKVSPEYAKSLLANEANYLIVAEGAGQLLGFVWAYCLARLDQRRPQLFIYEVDVAEAHQRGGVGTALLEYVCELVNRLHLMEAFVLTSSTNADAIGLYTKTGGVAQSEPEIIFVYPGHPVSVHSMVG